MYLHYPSFLPLKETSTPSGPEKERKKKEIRKGRRKRERVGERRKEIHYRFCAAKGLGHNHLKVIQHILSIILTTQLTNYVLA